MVKHKILQKQQTANPVIIRNYNYKNKLNKKKMQTRARPSEILDGRDRRWATNYL